MKYDDALPGTPWGVISDVNKDTGTVTITCYESPVAPEEVINEFERKQALLETIRELTEELDESMNSGNCFVENALDAVVNAINTAVYVIKKETEGEDE